VEASIRRLDGPTVARTDPA